MLTIEIQDQDLFSDPLQEFIHVRHQFLKLEHSLISISKWESKWHVPFMSKEPRTIEQEIDYIRCMTLPPEADPIVYQVLTRDQLEQIRDYMADKMTATTFKDIPGRNINTKGEFITSEVIYYWMIALNIPTEYEKWHINRLMTLIEVCNRKNAPSKKMSRQQQIQQNKALNAARRSKYHSKG